MVDYIRVLKLRLPGTHNLKLGVVHRMVELVHRMVELVHRMVEVVLLLGEVVVVEVLNLMEVVLTVMLFQVGQRLKPQMLLSQILFRFVIDQLLYYLIQDLLILMCPHILLLV